MNDVVGSHGAFLQHEPISGRARSLAGPGMVWGSFLCVLYQTYSLFFQRCRSESVGDVNMEECVGAQCTPASRRPSHQP